MAWKDSAATLKANGFSDQEIQQEQDRKINQWREAGFSDTEIDTEFYPEKQNVAAAGQAAVKQNLAQQAAVDPTSFETEEGLMDNFAKGIGMSSAGVLARRAYSGQSADKLQPDPESFKNKVSYSIGQLVGDIPVDAVSRIGGGLIAAGAMAMAAPVVGLGAGAVAIAGLLGQGFGATSTSEFIRNYWTDSIDAGETDKASALSKLTTSAWEATKAGVVGALTLGVGTKARAAAKLAGVEAAVGEKLTGQALKDAIAKNAVKTEFAGLGSELTTAVVAGSAMHGELPEAEDFLHAAAVVGSLKATGVAYDKVKSVYRKTGIKPLDTAMMSEQNVNVKEDMLSANKEIPTALKPMIENKSPEEVVEFEYNDKVSGEKIPDEVTFTGDEVPAVQSTKDAQKTSDDFLARKQAGEFNSPEKELDAALEAMDKHVGTQEQAEAAQKKPFNLKQAWSKAYQATVDELNAIKNLDPATYILARNTRGVTGKGMLDLNVGYHDPITFEKKIDSPKKLYRDFSPEKFRKLNNYLAAKQSLLVGEEGHTIGVPIEPAKVLVSALDGEFGHIHQALTDFQNTMLKDLARPELGLISEKSKEAILNARLLHVPLQKLIQYNDAHVRELQGIPGQKQVKQRLTHAIEATMTRAPIEAFEQNIHTLNSAMAINRVKLELLNKHKKMFEEKFAATQELYEPSPELAEILAKHGVDRDSLDAVAFALKSRSLKPGEVDIYVDGRRKIFQVGDPLLADSMNHLHAEQLPDNMFMNLARKASQLTRTVTGMPDFVMKQLVMDKLSQSILSEHGNIKDHIGEAFKVGFNVMNHLDQEYFQKYLASGGLVTFIDDFEPLFNKKDGVQALHEQTGFLNGTRNVIRNGFDFIKIAGQATELNTRLVEFNLARAGSQDPTKISEAAFKSRDVILDFQRKGASNFLRSWNAITAFQNAGIQGLDKFGREALDRPSAIIKRGAGLVTAATVLNWQIHKDDPMYQNASNYEKFAFWVIPFHNWKEATVNDSPDGFAPYQRKLGEDGKIYYDHGFAVKVPKPGIIGHVFGSSVEIALNNAFAAKSAKTTFGEAAELFGGNVQPFGVPNLLMPAVGGFANYNMQTGHALIPEYTMGLLPQARYNDSTTETSKILSRAVADIPVLGQSHLVSPAVIDYALQQWGMKGFLDVVDLFPKMTVQTRPELTLNDVPFVKTFLLKNPTASNSYVMRAMESGRELEQQIKTANQWVASGNEFEKKRGLQILRNINQDPQKLRIYGAMQGLREIGSTIHFINGTDSMTKAQKRESIDRMYYLMHETAKNVLGVNQ